MSRAARWIAVCIAGVGVFAFTWWLAETVFGVDRGTAQAFAGLAVALATVPAGWWFAKEIRDDDRHRRPVPTAVVVIVTLVLAAIGAQLWRTTSGRGDGDGRDGGTARIGDGDTQSVTVNKTVWYSGLKVTVGKVSYDPTADEQVVADVTLANEASDGYQPYLFKVSLHSGGQFYQGDLRESNPVPALATSRYHLQFRVDSLDGGLGAATLLFGRGEEAQPAIPLGDGEPVANEPRVVLSSAKVSTRDLRLTKLSCQLRADFLRNPRQADKGQYVLGCTFDVRYVGTILHWFRGANMRLRLPDGTSVSPAEAPYELMQDDQIIHGVYAGFTFAWPAPGRYVLQIVDPDNDPAPTRSNTYDLPFTA
jgi:hypothetical protein